MNVVVTGGAGFIGSHIVDLLTGDDHCVLAIDDFSAGSPANVNPSAQLTVLPVESSEVFEVFNRFKPHAVVHCAAQTSVAVSWQQAQRDATVNIGGSINIIRACINHGVRKLVYCSSAAVYGNPFAIPIDENHPANPISPYGISKLTVEHYLKTFHLQYGLDFAALRFANVYGPRQRADLEGGVVAIFVDQIRSGLEQPTVFGDGAQTRDFVFVKDVARAVVLAIQSQGVLTANVSSGTEVSINQLVKSLALITKKDLHPRYGPPRSGDITRSCLDNALMKRSLGWQPATPFEEGLRLTWLSADIKNPEPKV